MLAGLWPSPGTLKAGEASLEIICAGSVVGTLGRMHVEPAKPLATTTTSSIIEPRVVSGPLSVALEGRGMASVSANAEGATCESGGMQAARINVKWSRAGSPEGVKVFVQQHGGERKIWSVSGARGESTTGPWADEGITLWFEDDQGGARLCRYHRSHLCGCGTVGRC